MGIIQIFLFIVLGLLSENFSNDVHLLIILVYFFSAWTVGGKLSESRIISFLFSKAIFIIIKTQYKYVIREFLYAIIQSSMLRQISMINTHHHQFIKVTIQIQSNHCILFLIRFTILIKQNKVMALIIHQPVLQVQLIISPSIYNK